MRMRLWVVAEPLLLLLHNDTRILCFSGIMFLIFSGVGSLLQLCAFQSDTRVRSKHGPPTIGQIVD